MAYSHRQGDARICGATTVVTSQDFVTIEDKLWACHGDPNTDGGGGLIASNDWITINGKAIIVKGDSANPDSLCPFPGGPHCAPAAQGFSSLVDVG